MSETVYTKLQTAWPMLIGSKSTKFRQELLALYEQEQQAQRTLTEQAQAEKVAEFEKLLAEKQALEAEVAKLQQQLVEQQQAKEQELQRLHEQVLQKIVIMEEQAELYFVKNTENQVK